MSETAAAAPNASPERRVVFGLGSNLGDRTRTIGRAAREILAWGREGKLSALYESAAHGPVQPDYLNAAVAIVTAESPEQLLARAQELEAVFGRVREVHWGPRTLDVDLLWIESCVVCTPTLVVPHPELVRRAFALLPLLDAVPDAVDPRSGRFLRVEGDAVAHQSLSCVARGSWAEHG